MRSVQLYDLLCESLHENIYEHSYGYLHEHTLAKHHRSCVRCRSRLRSPQGVRKGARGHVREIIRVLFHQRMTKIN